MSPGRKDRSPVSPMRVVFLVLIPLVAGTILLAWGIGGPKVHTLDTPESGAGYISIPVYETGKPDRTPDELRVGSFEPPEEVPEYGIIEEKPADTEDARAVRLLVDTPAREKADYVLITRDIKARYADLDAISIEFTDTEDLLDYNGAALIFNTPKGATYMGFIYGPPNTQGYYVRAAD